MSSFGITGGRIRPGAVRLHIDISCVASRTVHAVSLQRCLSEGVRLTPIILSSYTARRTQTDFRSQSNSNRLIARLGKRRRDKNIGAGHPARTGLYCVASQSNPADL